MTNSLKVYTIGHSTTSFATFINYLHAHNVDMLVDVRSLPGSRHVPHFNKEHLMVTLPRNNISYMHFSKLGGRRKSAMPDHYELVDGWENASFRNYASYTLTPEYRQAIDELTSICAVQTSCLMCAEVVPWKCHRSIISNSLTNLGVQVYHIMNDQTATLHQINKYGAKAVQQNGKLIYPSQ